MSQSVHLWGLVPSQKVKKQTNSYLFSKMRASKIRAEVSAKHTCVCVEMVPQQGDSPEGTSTQVTFVRPLIRVALHVTVEVGASWAGVATQLALECLLHTWTRTHIDKAFLKAQQEFCSLYLQKYNSNTFPATAQEWHTLLFDFGWLWRLHVAHDLLCINF